MSEQASRQRLCSEERWPHSKNTCYLTTSFVPVIITSNMLVSIQLETYFDLIEVNKDNEYYKDRWSIYISDYEVRCAIACIIIKTIYSKKMQNNKTATNKFKNNKIKWLYIIAESFKIRFFKFKKIIKYNYNYYCYYYNITPLLLLFELIKQPPLLFEQFSLYLLLFFSVFSDK